MIPWDSFQNHIQQTIHQCHLITDRHQQKYLLQIKPAAPKLNVMITIHKNNNQIRPVINSIQHPLYKLAGFLSNTLYELTD